MPLLDDVGSVTCLFDDVESTSVALDGEGEAPLHSVRFSRVPVHSVSRMLPSPSDIRCHCASASSAVFGLAAPMRLVRFSSSSLELGLSDPHSDVFVDDGSLRLIRFFVSSFPDLGLDRSRPENVSSTISNSSRNGENRDHAISNLKEMGRIVVFLEGRIVMILEGFLLDCKLGSSTLRLPQLMLLRGFLLACKLGSSAPLLLLRGIVFWKRVVPRRMIAPLLKILPPPLRS